jgi:hypothetical protein
VTSFEVENWIFSSALRSIPAASAIAVVCVDLDIVSVGVVESWTSVKMPCELRLE